MERFVDPFDSPARSERPKRNIRRAYEKMLDAQNLLDNGMFEEGVATIRSGIKADPFFWDLVDLLTITTMKVGRPDLMRAGLLDAYRRGNSHESVLGPLVHLSLMVGEEVDALRFLDEFERRNPRKRKIGPYGIKALRNTLLRGIDARSLDPGGPAPATRRVTREAGLRKPPAAPGRRRGSQSPKHKPNGRAGHSPRAPEEAERPRRTNSPATVSDSGPVAKPAPPSPTLEVPPLPPITVDLKLERAGFLDRLFAGDFQDRTHYDLCLAAHHLGMIGNIDELLCVSHLRGVQQLRYQIETVRKVLRRFRGRALLCDEVGLGKTVEAGMIIKEYLLRGLVRSVLVLVPPTLVGQWSEEMAGKFDLAFETTSGLGYKRDANQFWSTSPRIIASLATAKSVRNHDLVSAREFDLIVIDEAHHLRNRTTQAWKLANGLKSRFLLLLTATPLQNNLMELHNLITILKPGQLSTTAGFTREFVSRRDPTQPKNKEKLRELLSEVMIRNTRALAGVSLPPRHAVTRIVEPTIEEARFYSRVSEFVRANYRAVDSRGIDRLTLQLLQMEAGSSAQAFAQTARKLLDRASGPDGAEQAVDNQGLGSAQNGGRGSGLAEHDTARSRAEQDRGEAGGTMVNGLREELNQEPSPSDVGSVPSPGIAELLQLASGIPRSAKAAALATLLRDARADGAKKMLVFVNYRQTIHFLQSELERAGFSVVVFHGGLSGLEKDAIIDRFRTDSGIVAMLTTDVGAEGRNLQFCHSLVNYDLPWNPMRIEQRIGRIHRIGQDHEVEITSLCAQGSVEDHLLQVLDRKINMFELVIGEIDMILGQMEDQRDFSDRVLEAWASADTDNTAAQNFNRLGDELTHAKTGYHRIQALDEEMFGEDYEVS